MNLSRTKKVIPDGVQTLSKMPSKYVDGVYPTYIDEGYGCHVNADGKEYTDFTGSLGVNILGHADETVNRAVKEQVGKGINFPMPHELETELAEKLIELFPVQMVRFLKTGSETTSAAVKIARAFTKKETILCCGYHGWHEWYNQTTPKNEGCAKSKVYPFEFNDIKSLEERFKKHKNVAAVIMEPYVYEEPKNNFLVEVKRLCQKNKALLIFDEVVTGFRTQKWCAANMFNVQPDLMCLSKAMANGFPIAAVGGRKDVMKVLEGDCFVSSSFGGDLVGITASLATIKVIEERGVIKHIWDRGASLKQAFNTISQNEGINAECIGYPCRTYFKFPSPLMKSVFWQECLKKGVMFGHAQFITASHGIHDIDEAIDAIRHAIRMLRKHKDNLEDLLEGDVAKETLRLQK